MTDLEPRVAAAMMAAAPSFDGDAGDWQQVLRDAGQGASRGWIRRAVVVAAGAATVLAALLASPFSGEQPGVIDHALAAVGDGPVLHVVLEGEWGGDLVDLETGARKHVPGISELWYDANRGLLRSVTRLGDEVQTDETFRPRGRWGELAALAERYREALQSRTARIAGEAEVAGEPVWWLAVRSRETPYRAGRETTARIEQVTVTEQVAVSKATYEPVALRATSDGAPIRESQRLVRLLEYVSVARAGFANRETLPRLVGPFFFSPGLTGRELTAAEAQDLLGRRPVWLGLRFRGLPLVRIGKEAAGRVEPVTRDRSDIAGAVFAYGVSSEPDPNPSRPSVVVRETAVRPDAVFPGNALFPAGGTAFVTGRNAFLQRGGLFVRIEASSEELTIEAARALRPMQR